jgi:hypothetical protein
VGSERAAARLGPTPCDAARIRWHDPTGEQATLWKVEWDPAEGGGEDEVWRAVEVLAGGPVQR